MGQRRNKHLNEPSAFIDCSNTMDDVYANIDDYNPSRKRKILIIFGDMILDVKSNNKKKSLKAIIKGLFIKCKKINISLVFIT